MTYSIKLFDELISNSYDSSFAEEYSIIEEIKKTAFSLKTNQELKLYVQNHQLALLEQKKYKVIANKCDKVLYFLETYFCGFVNDKLQISTEGGKQLLEINSSFNEDLVSELENKISETLYKTIRPLLEVNKTGPITIYKTRYIIQFWENWFSELVSPNEKEVISYLISQNFNPPNFFKYVTGEIIGEMDQEADPYMQEQILERHINSITIIPAKFGNPYLTDYPDIKSLIIDWLKLEVKQCKIKQKRYSISKTTTSKNVHKIETSMSVAQTAYLFKLFAKSGVITNKVQMDTLHVLSEKFRSKKVESISFDSLQNKYYNVEDRTKEAIKEILERALKNIE